MNGVQAKKGGRGRGRPPAKGKAGKRASKYYDSDDDVVYRFVKLFHCLG